MVSEINSTEQSDLTSYFFMVSEINSTEQSDLTSYFFMVSEINSTEQSDQIYGFCDKLATSLWFLR